MKNAKNQLSLAVVVASILIGGVFMYNQNEQRKFTAEQNRIKYEREDAEKKALDEQKDSEKFRDSLSKINCESDARANYDRIVKINAWSSKVDSSGETIYEGPADVYAQAEENLQQDLAQCKSLYAN